MVNGHLGASLLKELDSEDIYSLLTGGIPKKHFYLSKKDIKNEYNSIDEHFESITELEMKTGEFSTKH